MGRSLVVKMGGGRLCSPSLVRESAGAVLKLARKRPVAAVCAATAGTTDELISAADCARRGSPEALKIAGRIEKRHAKLTRAAVKKDAVRKRALRALGKDFAQMRALLEGASVLGEVTPRSMDYLLSFGERASAGLVAAALADMGGKAEVLSGQEAGILTDSNFGDARPLMDTTRLRVAKSVGGALERGAVPVIAGFSGADQHGSVTTLGRGGSDYTAAIVGACLGADEVWLVGDSGGLLTADPGLVEGARVLEEVSFAEAVEMTLFGSTHVHPRTFEPLLGSGTAARIKGPSGDGTRISAESDGTVKCVSSVRHNGLIDVRGGMAGSRGTAAKIFGELARAGINVMMISQSPSESSITVVVRKADLDGAVHALESGLLGAGIKGLEVTSDVAIVALIGSGMRGTAGVASRVFGAVGREGINVVMITQGSSELNLAFAVRDSDAAGAVRAVHAEFGLGK